MILHFSQEKTRHQRIQDYGRKGVINMLKRILLSLLISVFGVLGISYVPSAYGDDIYWKSGNVWKNVQVLEYKNGKIKVKRSKDTQWWQAFDRIVFKEIEGEEVAPDVSATFKKESVDLKKQAETGGKKSKSSSKSWGGTDMIGRKLLSAIHDKSLTEVQFAELSDKYDDRQIRLTGYMVEAKYKGYINVYLKSDPDLSSYDICGSVSANTPLANRVKRLKKGQKITVVGSFSWIEKTYSGYVIYMGGIDRIYP